MKIAVDWQRCTGIGICESIAPEYYEVNDDGQLIVLRENVAEDDLDVITKTVAECPSGALSLLAE